MITLIARSDRTIRVIDSTETSPTCVDSTSTSPRTGRTPTLHKSKSLPVLSASTDASDRKVESENIIFDNLAKSSPKGTPQGGSSAYTGADPSPTSASTTSSVGKGNKRLRSGGSNRAVKAARPSTSPTDDESPSDKQRFACPFAQHNSERYRYVYMSCTHPPGLDIKYLK